MSMPWREKDRFPIDWKSFVPAIKAACGKVGGVCYSNGSVDLICSEKLSDVELGVLNDLWSGLTEGAQAALLAKASRKIGSDLVVYLDAKKQAAAVKDWASMSVAERKLMSGASLTDDEIDSL